ncbi:hypothetical protein [Anaerococcus sp.]|uniref:hypothetical protein n=1 Tax=Anaerococcus sp. TaxID=1872515 RepID=UPI00280B1E77|nr:hypothetical protein [Anaerococcus sp.]MDU3176680.1 hypothetical protein [Anaerococcus sp.]
MSLIDIFYINLSPVLDVDVSRDKSIELNKIFDSYKKHIDSEATINDVIMLSYYPKYDNKYTKLVDAYIKNFVNDNQSILIFKSLLDLSNFTITAHNKLVSLYELDSVKAIYFTDYSLKYDLSHYGDKLNSIFKSDISRSNIGKDDSPKRSTYGPNIKYAVNAVRFGDEFDDFYDVNESLIEIVDSYNHNRDDNELPVAYKYIEEITGIKESTLRNFPRYDYYFDGSRISGRVPTSEEKDILKSGLKYDLEDILADFDIVYQKYIPNV